MKNIGGGGGVRFFLPRICHSSLAETQVLSFHTLAHSFAPTKNSTRLFSIDSALFAKNHPGWGRIANASRRDFLPTRRPPPKVSLTSSTSLTSFTLTNTNPLSAPTA